MIPGLFEGAAPFHRDVENGDGPSGAAGEDYRAGLGDETRAARAIDCKSDVAALFQVLGERGKPFNRAAIGTSLRCAKAEALNDAARPLTIEIDGVEHHDAAIFPDPSRGENATM